MLCFEQCFIGAQSRKVRIKLHLLLYCCKMRRTDRVVCLEYRRERHRGALAAQSSWRRCVALRESQDRRTQGMDTDASASRIASIRYPATFSLAVLCQQSPNGNDPCFWGLGGSSPHLAQYPRCLQFTIFALTLPWRGYPGSFPFWRHLLVADWKLHGSHSLLWS